MLEVSIDSEAEPGTIPPTAKGGGNEGIMENHGMISKDAAPDEVNLSKASDSTSSEIKEWGEGLEETSNLINACKSIVKKHKKTPAKYAFPAEVVAY